MASAITLTVDRVKGTVSVTGDSLFIRDPSVSVTLVNILQADIDATLVLEFCANGRLLASITNGWTVDENDSAVGALSTNTLAFVNLFALSDEHCVKHISVKGYTANPLEPIFSGYIKVTNFTSAESGTPTKILLPSESLAAVQADILLLQEAIPALRAEFASAISLAVGALQTSLRSEFQAADTVVAGAIGPAIVAHNASGSAHADIRNLCVFCGSAIYMQCNEGALADSKWRKLVPSEPNEFGEYMWMVKQSPTYTYNTGTTTWDEES
jgi:hypothetical protein